MKNLQLLNKCTIDYGWATVLVGLKLNLLNAKEIGNFAQKFVVDNPKIDNEILMELLWGNRNDEEVINLIEKLMKELKISLDYSKEKRKWRYCLLNYFREECQDTEKLLEKIAEIYSDFDYPSDMVNLIYYMHPEDDYNPKVHSKENNIGRLLNNIDVFLKREKEFLRTK